MQEDSSPEKARQVDRGTDVVDHDVTESDTVEPVAPEDAPDSTETDTAGTDADSAETDSGESGSTENDDPPTVTPKTTRTRRTKRPWGWITASVLLFLALGGVTAAAIHLWNVSLLWEERVDELTVINYELGRDLVAEQETALEQVDQIELLSQQRETLQQRLLDLSETANLSRDNVATAEQEIDGLVNLVAQAAAVSNALNRCVDSQNQLADFLREVQAADPEGPPVYDPADLQAYEDSVDQLCDAATAANAQLQRDLTS